MRKILFIDRDGTLIHEPDDFQIDRVEKFSLLPGVIQALLELRDAGYSFVMVTNQDALGSDRYPQKDFDVIQTLLLGILKSQGIRFEKILVCPHEEKDGCECRKPRTGLVQGFLADPAWDRKNSYVIGDRETDLTLAKRIGIPGIRIAEKGENAAADWNEISIRILSRDRVAETERKTKETKIEVRVNLDQAAPIEARTGIGFFDHMLESLAKHGGFSLKLKCEGDLVIDEHHTVEDCALALGEALNQALGDRAGTGRFGFTLPMDETLATAALDLGGRPYFVLDGVFPRENVGGLHTEMVPHFFRSLVETLGANLHLLVTGENTHHMVEACFKSVGRSLRQAIGKSALGEGIPSTKGVL